MRLVSPNGVIVDACDEAVEGLFAMGFKPAGGTPPEKKATPKKKAPAKKASAKKKG